MFNRERLTGLLLPGLNSLAVMSLLATTLCLLMAGVPDASAKTPGSTYCYHGKCHHVKTIAETAAMVGRDEVVYSSFYDDCRNDRYNPCGLTSSGAVYQPDRADNTASPTYPDGTVLLVRNPANDETAVLRVNNAGPYWGNRTLDVSRAAAEKLGFVHTGVAKLEIRVLEAPQPEDARYQKYRVYDAVPGYIGRFPTVQLAEAGVSAHRALQRVAALQGSALSDSVPFLPQVAELTTMAGTQSTPAAILVKLDAPAVGLSEKVKPVTTEVASAGSTTRKTATRLAQKRGNSVRVASNHRSHVKRQVASGGTKVRHYAAARVRSLEEKTRLARLHTRGKSHVAAKGRHRGSRYASRTRDPDQVHGRGQRGSKRIAESEHRRSSRSRS